MPGVRPNALSIRRVRALARRAGKRDVEFEAVWSAAGWLLPVQVVGLAIAGAGIGAWLGLPIAVAFVMLLGTPLLMGMLEGLSVSGAGAVAWYSTLALAGYTWWWAAGSVPAAVLAGIGAVAYPWCLRRHRAQVHEESHPAELPAALTDRIAALPTGLDESVKAPVDRGLSAFGSLVRLTAGAQLEGIDAEGLRRDAEACIGEIIEKTSARIELDEVTVDSEAVTQARASLAAQVEGLVDSLTAAVDAAAAYRAAGAGASDAGRELAERAAHLHDVAEGLESLAAGHMR